MTAAAFAKLRKRIATGFVAFVSALAISVSPASAAPLIRDAEIEATLREYATPLWQAANIRPEDVHIYIVNDNSLNAFVAGGQNIFVHTGLIMAARNPNEIIGVLAHETGHISGGHLARSREAQQQAMAPMLISIGLGVLAIAAGAPQAGAALIGGSQGFAMGNYVRYTQVQESAADQAAATLLEDSGQSGRGLISFFNNNLRQYEFQQRRMPPYLMTHPFSSDRVEALRQRVEAAPHRDAEDSAENLQRFRFMQAKLVGFIQSQGQTLAKYPLSDTSAPARYARAVAYYRVSQLDQARAELDRLIAEDPRNPYFQELYGQILFENGRAAESVPYHRRSVELAPREPLLLINLARALDTAQGRAGTDEAIALLQQAIDIEPDNAYAWRELATARDLRGEEALAQLASAEQNFSMGDYGAALSFAERARRTLPHNTPSFQRASDIVTFAGEEMRERAQQRGGRS
ncbi:M48 family metalloprotease [Terricaulis sp.]|uniref:M48 family metalloprotease n=1 Tax=Terricaulis sp. TaxID=2768686 RepID=UPI0037832022